MAPATAADPVAEGFLGQLTSLTSLTPSPLNPRKRFDDASMKDLIENVRKHGVIVPLIVRRRAGLGEVIDGERRFRAATAAGVKTVPAIFRDDLSDGEVIELQLLSAIQRQDLTPLEEASGFKALIDSNRSHYSPAYIADRVGRTEKWVWDRMKLLDLIPVLKQLLDAERILVGHAEILCKLKSEDQERAVGWDGENLGSGRRLAGLWETEIDRLRLDDEDDEEPSPKNLYHGLKPVTVKELESWVGTSVRFDVKHMAEAAPLEFGEVAQQVEEAQAAPGRGKKVISITNEYRVDDAAKDPHDRTYGAQSWQRADGENGSEACDHSVLGLFVAGPGYGTSLQVCISRDKCRVHYAEVIRAKEKAQKLREKGKGGRAAQVEKKAEESYEQKWQREAAERRAREAAWAKIWPPLEAEALRQVKDVKALTSKQAAAFEKSSDISINPDACKEAGFTWWKNLPQALLVSEIATGEYCDDFKDFAKQIAPIGLDIKKLEAVRDKHTPESKPEPKTEGKRQKARQSKKGAKR